MQAGVLASNVFAFYLSTQHGSGEDTSGYAYNRTASGEVSFNFELWPTFYEKEREAALSADSLGARPLGYHTFSARSGWYGRGRSWASRTVSCGYFSGCSMASSRVSRFSTLMFAW